IGELPLEFVQGGWQQLEEFLHLLFASKPLKRRCLLARV
ncbi:hypothetical protein EAH_00050000, partial [Eimeria acervulina]